MLTAQLVLDGHLTAVENMRRDDVLLARAEPVVRLYGWAPEAVSLGNSQTDAVIDLDVAREYSLDVIKRGTGGGGILHAATEITYAVIVPIDFPTMPRDLPGSFAFLGDGVLRALRALGLLAEIDSQPDRTRDALCYVRQQGTNIVVGGKKISGGAQRRTRNAVLQHGTVIIERDETRCARVFRTNVETITSRVTSVRAEGKDPTRPQVIDALVAGYTQTFGALSPTTWESLEPVPHAGTGWVAGPLGS
jgi:lipoate-protein ligase A